MSNTRSVMLALNNIPENQAIDLLHHEVVTKYGTKHNMLPALTGEIVVTGVRVCIENGLQIFLPLPRQDLDTNVDGEVRVNGSETIELKTKTLALTGTPYRRDFPEMFFGGKDVQWLGLDAHITVDFGVAILKAAVGSQRVYFTVQDNIVGTCDEVDNHSPMPEAMEKEIRAIRDGSISFDLVVKYVFTEMPSSVKPVQKINRAPQVVPLTTDFSLNATDYVANEVISYRNFPVTHRGNVECEVSRAVKKGGLETTCEYTATFMNHRDAQMFATIMAYMEKNHITHDDVLKRLDAIVANARKLNG